MNHKLELGKATEEAAWTYLKSRFPEMKLIARNYRWRGGELDLVIEDLLETGKSELVFVEVRARLEGSWEGGVESVGAVKRRRIRRTVQRFLSRYSGKARSLRLDVLGWDGRDWDYLPNAWLWD